MFSYLFSCKSLHHKLTHGIELAIFQQKKNIVEVDECPKGDEITCRRGSSIKDVFNFLLKRKKACCLLFSCRVNPYSKECFSNRKWSSYATMAESLLSVGIPSMSCRWHFCFSCLLADAVNSLYLYQGTRNMHL